MRTPRLNLVVLRVVDLERAAAFYGALGVAFERHRHGGGPEHYAAEAHGGVFELYPATPEHGATAAARIGFAVADVDAAVQHAEAAGGRVVSAPAASPWGRRAVVEDPDGHRVELTAEVLAVAAGYSIRPARADDLPALPEIERAAGALFPDHLITEEARNEVVPPDVLAAAQAEGRLWVAVDAHDVPVGSALASMSVPTAVLEEVGVHPDHGRRGLGRLLVEAAVAWARGVGAHEMVLTTFASLPWNAPFYERLGFRRLEGAAVGSLLAGRLAEETRSGLQDRVAMRLSWMDDG